MGGVKWFSLEGMVGVGKTTILKRLGRKYIGEEGVVVIEEEPRWLGMTFESRSWFDTLEVCLNKPIQKAVSGRPRGERVRVVVTDRSLEAVQVFHPTFVPRFSSMAADLAPLSETVVLTLPYQNNLINLKTRARPCEVGWWGGDGEGMRTIYNSFRDYKFKNEVRVTSTDLAFDLLDYGVTRVLQGDYQEGGK